MKKRTERFLSFLLIALLASGNAFSFVFPLSPHDLGAFLKTNFKFVEDRQQFGLEDYWQSPEEFLSRRAGDCEDFALLSQSLLTRLGLKAFVVSLYGENYAHTVTVFIDEQGLFNVVNQEKVHSYRTETIEEALTEVHSDWTWAGIAELRNTRGWMLRKITRPR